MRPENDTIDLGEILAALRRKWLWVLGGTVAGVLLALLATMLLRPQYDGRATVLLRGQTESSPLASLRNAGLPLGGLADVLGGESGYETEVQILTSRAVTGAVVDSLGLQARVLEPRGWSALQLFGSVRFDPDLRRGVYRFQRSSDGYRVEGPGISTRAVPGAPLRLGNSVVTLRAVDLPEEFEVELIDRQEAIDRVQRELETRRAGGEVAELAYRASDPRTAAAVPNAMVAQYLARRRTTDRGVNQQRYEFLAAHVDSIRTDLARAEADLRRTQEQTGVVDPEIYGRAELEQGMALRAALESAEVEARALQQLLTQAAAGDLAARSLAAYPTFLRNGAINELLSSLLELETERTGLLERRTERDPDVIVLDQQIRQLEDQLVRLSQAYLEGLNRQQTQLRTELWRYENVLGQLPAQAQEFYRAQREVRRLSETLVALQTQLVQARLAAMGEGGDVRLVDVAVPPKVPAFPNPLLNLAIGLVGGLFLGVMGALGSVYLGRRIREPYEAELAAGVPAVALDNRTPLLLGGLDQQRSVLVLPVGPAAHPGVVACRIAAMAALQGTSVVLADLAEGKITALPPSNGSIPSSSGGPGVAVTPRVEQAVSDALHPADGSDGGGYLIYRGSENGGATIGVRAVLAELERRFTLVVAALPPLTQPVTTALLGTGRSVVTVVRSGQATRAELRDAVDALNRLRVPVLAVLVDRSGKADADRGA